MGKTHRQENKQINTNYKQIEGCVENGFERQMAESEECLVNMYVLPTPKEIHTEPSGKTVSRDVC